MDRLKSSAVDQSNKNAGNSIRLQLPGRLPSQGGDHFWLSGEAVPGSQGPEMPDDRSEQEFIPNTRHRRRVNQRLLRFRI